MFLWGLLTKVSGEKCKVWCDTQRVFLREGLVCMLGKFFPTPIIHEGTGGVALFLASTLPRAGGRLSILVNSVKKLGGNFKPFIRRGEKVVLLWF